MWYMLPQSNKQYPLTIQRVKEIKRLNSRGEKVQDLQPIELHNNKLHEAEPVFVDVVGQISLGNLEKTSRRRHEQERRQRNGQQEIKRNQQRPLQQKPTQQKFQQKPADKKKDN